MLVSSDARPLKLDSDYSGTAVVNLSIVRGLFDFIIFSNSLRGEIHASYINISLHTIQRYGKDYTYFTCTSSINGAIIFFFRDSQSTNISILTSMRARNAIYLLPIWGMIRLVDGLMSKLLSE